ncbi:Thiamine-monophosphate kinase [Corynebacterium heidelbergense]|nr:thiamine-phosphate kinase [Corynebacterium heidelbergense]WCZ36807.1 Thiamine-monophosphate kinase [Corynebacterium heidelbergense]
MRNPAGSRRDRRSAVTVGQAGEAGTIAAIRSAAPSALNGDDAAVLDVYAPNSRHVCTTDILVQDRHFSFRYSSPYEVGIKAITQNFADIQAMGARPTAVLMAIATPTELPLAHIHELARGINDAASPWSAELVGGDVVRSKDLVISITALGELVGPAPALTLDGAAVGDRVIASGVIGHSAAGLAILEHFGSRRAVPADDAVLSELVDWHCAPRLTPGRGSGARAAKVNSLTDNSDGLIRDAAMIAERSGVCIDFAAAAIAPDEKLLHAAERTGQDPWRWVLTGGEDHTLVGTTSQTHLPAGYRVIGSVVAVSEDAEVVDPPAVTVDGRSPRYRDGWESL